MKRPSKNRGSGYWVAVGWRWGPELISLSNFGSALEPKVVIIN